METVIVPPSFAVLFILPLVIGFYVYDKTVNTTLSLGIYISLQIGLAVTARIIYG